MQKTKQAQLTLNNRLGKPREPNNRMIKIQPESYGNSENQKCLDIQKQEWWASKKQLQWQCEQSKTCIEDLEDTEDVRDIEAIEAIEGTRSIADTTHIGQIDIKERIWHVAQVIPKAKYRTTEVQNHRKILDFSKLGLFLIISIWFCNIFYGESVTSAVWKDIVKHFLDSIGKCLGCF